MAGVTCYFWSVRHGLYDAALATFAAGFFEAVCWLDAAGADGGVGDCRHSGGNRAACLSGVCAQEPGQDSSGCGLWKFEGAHHAPGVVLVDGNLEVGGGTYTNTFIATGNLDVTTSGGAVFALNYAGPNGISVNGSTALGVCSNAAYRIRPGEFCRGGYNHNAHGGLGNYAVMAGSCPLGSINGCARSAYIGGDIDIRRAVFGVTRAGNLVTTGGQARLYGYVSALAQRNNATTGNSLAASTTINLQVPPAIRDRYDPSGGLMPTDGGGGGGIPGESTPGSVQLQWGRYL